MHSEKMRLNTTKKPMRLMETVFDFAYLGTVLVSGILLLLRSSAGSVRREFGFMALILAIGDAFHLIPRIFALWDGSAKDYRVPLGIGKMVASLTMTVFYVILWNAGASRYPGTVVPAMTAAVYALAALRIALCLFPQNRWTSEDPPLRWAILRNIPFLALGMSVAALFAAGSRTKADGLSLLHLAVIVSFACYLPVVLLSGRNRKVGALMLPKSCAYAAIVLMGFSIN